MAEYRLGPAVSQQALLGHGSRTDDRTTTFWENVVARMGPPRNGDAR